MVGWVLYCANVALTSWQVISPLGPPVAPSDPLAVATNKYPGYVSAPTLGTLDDSYDTFTFNPVSTVVLLYAIPYTTSLGSVTLCDWKLNVTLKLSMP
jgi:hypothetical protein